MASEQHSAEPAFAYVEAYPIALLGGPVSPAAVALVERLVENIFASEKRPTSVQKGRQAIGALMADLLDLHRGHSDDRHPWPGAHGMSPKDFPSKTLGFGHGIFLNVITKLEAAGLLTITVGQPRFRKAFGQVHNFNGQVTTFQLTPALVSLAASFGVELNAWKEHWAGAFGSPVAAPADEDRLVLRNRKVRVLGKKLAAEDTPFDKQAPGPAAILAGIDRLNRNLLRHDIGGITFPGLRRIFSDGDQPDFAWNRGGRYYSLPGGHRYEAMSAERRLERITFDGERVGEADIRASHLTLLHALLDRPLDLSSDPYAVDGVDRTLVKWWCTQAIGSSNPEPRQWATDKKATYAAQNGGRQLQADFPIARVGEAVVGRHPCWQNLRPAGYRPLISSSTRAKS
ncbi:hypothetical protein [Novosphingobium panipatense]|uniref:hypothetical protein n=1 Tax=Novosphingobium panipatense TaxID=428991 RepID=UPI0036227DB2